MITLPTAVSLGVFGEVALVTFVVIVFAIILLGIGLFWFFVCEECLKGTIAMLKRGSFFKEE